MSKLTKKKKNIYKNIKINSVYSIEEAINALRTLSSVKFIESLDISINLNVDSRKSEHIIKSYVILPNPIGKTYKIAVFAKGDAYYKAQDFGDNIVVGLEDLIEKFKTKKVKYDIVIATSDVMDVVGKIGPILGPRGLMPNIKFGTLTNDIQSTLSNIKRGQIRYCTDKNGIIHLSIGKINFSNVHLIENIKTLIEDIKKHKPNVIKGIFFKKIFLSTTMGPSLLIDLNTILN